MTQTYTLISQNSDFDFFICNQKLGNYWYTIAVYKGKTPEDDDRTIAGFCTKKTAIAAAKKWATWMFRAQETTLFLFS